MISESLNATNKHIHIFAQTRILTNCMNKTSQYMYNINCCFCLNDHYSITVDIVAYTRCCRCWCCSNRFQCSKHLDFCCGLLLLLFSFKCERVIADGPCCYSTYDVFTSRRSHACVLVVVCM